MKVFAMKKKIQYIMFSKKNNLALRYSKSFTGFELMFSQMGTGKWKYDAANCD